jgi:hypothetical protein
MFVPGLESWARPERIDPRPEAGNIARAGSSRQGGPVGFSDFSGFSR